MARTYQSMITQVLKELEAKGRKTQVQYRDRSKCEILHERTNQILLNGSARYNGNGLYVITCPHVRCPVTLAVFLHEAGHIYYGHCETRHSPKLFRAMLFGEYELVHGNEIQASRYALRKLREFNVPTKQASRYLTKCIRTYRCQHTFRD